jgi:hypothetical protein
MDINLQGGRAPENVLELLDVIVKISDGLEKVFGFSGPKENVPLRRIIMGSTKIVEDANKNATELQFLEESGHIYWMRSMVEAIQGAVNDRLHVPSDAILNGEDGRFYRPTLLSIRRYADDNEPESAHIAFHESVTGPISNCPEDLSALGTVLRMGFRFKWEVLERYRFPNSAKEIQHIRRIVERMEQESHMRGYNRPSQSLERNLEYNPVFEAFPPELQPTIREIGEKWYELRNPEKTGRLDQAFLNEDIALTRKCLNELMELNKKFMTVASRRYAELVQQYWQ